MNYFSPLITTMDHHHPSSPTYCNSSSFCSTISNNSTSLKPSKKSRLSISTYKGIVPQPNGRCGAQFYEGNKRIWVGTFDNKDLAAEAYDTAVIRFRGPQTLTNFPIHNYTQPRHLDFLASLSKAQVIETLRTHTFQDELARFTQTRLPMNSDSDSHLREWLFEKVVTPSDVGRLHRLVVPTKYARKYLPNIEGKEKGGVLLSIEDGSKEKMWRFKYCYWSSSQNYVLTKGWGEFVKDRGLRAGDIVSFYASIGGNEKRFYIDTCPRLSRKPLVSGGGSGGGGDGGMVSLKNVEVIWG